MVCTVHPGRPFLLTLTTVNVDIIVYTIIMFLRFSVFIWFISAPLLAKTKEDRFERCKSVFKEG